MNAEAQPLGMTTNWSKTKIQGLGDCGAPCQCVSVQGNEVEVVEVICISWFPYPLLRWQRAGN